MVSWLLAFLFLVLCEVSIHVLVHVRVQAKNSNGLCTPGCTSIFSLWTTFQTPVDPCLHPLVLMRL